MKKKTEDHPATLRGDYNEVQLLEAKPNKMFPDWMTKRLKFLRYVRAVPCAACGKQSRRHWTMLMAFKACLSPKRGEMPFSLVAEPKVHPPLTPVCGDHIMQPIMPPKKKKT